MNWRREGTEGEGGGMGGRRERAVERAGL